jgi:WD40 repeat protein
MDMISFTAQPANLTLVGNLQGLQVHPNGELIVYADDQGVQTLVLETGATPVQLLNPPESGYYFVRRINSEVVIISQIFEDGSTTLGWSFIERRRFREAIPPEGANGFGCDTGVDLSPTANLLVVGGSNTEAACNLLPGLTIVDLEGETTESILDNQTVFSPVWSRDGSQIAFAQVDGPAVNLYLINPDGKGLKALTSYSSGGINSLAWGTKGNIYIGVNGLENPDEDGVYILNIHSGETRQLIIGSNVLVRQVAPDGDHLAFYENDGDFKIMIVPFNQIVPVVQGVGSFVTVGGWISLDE